MNFISKFENIEKKKLLLILMLNYIIITFLNIYYFITKNYNIIFI